MTGKSRHPATSPKARGATTTKKAAGKASQAAPKAAAKAAARATTAAKKVGKRSAAGPADGRSASAEKVAKWRAARRAAQKAAVAARVGKKVLTPKVRRPSREPAGPGRDPAPTSAGADDEGAGEPQASARRSLQEFQPDVLRRFQRWFREEAPPGQKYISAAEDMRRVLRLPWPTKPLEVRLWVFASLSFWWLTPYGRDAVGYQLLLESPDWDLIGDLLELAARGPRVGIAGQRRRGTGVLGSGASATQSQREVATMQCWRRAIVEEGKLAELTDADPALPKPSSTDAARCLGGLPSVGPYLVKSMLEMLTLTDRVRFDEGVMPPGSYSSVRYILTGDPKLVKQSLWPWSADPQDTQHHIATLARMEGCSWQDMQGALCHWAPWRRHAGSRRHARSRSHAPEHEDSGGESTV